MQHSNVSRRLPGLGVVDLLVSDRKANTVNFNATVERRSDMPSSHARVHVVDMFDRRYFCGKCGVQRSRDKVTNGYQRQRSLLDPASDRWTHVNLLHHGFGSKRRRMDDGHEGSREWNDVRIRGDALDEQIDTQFDRRHAKQRQRKI